jgi:hypothetical protein
MRFRRVKALDLSANEFYLEFALILNTRSKSTVETADDFIL